MVFFENSLKENSTPREMSDISLYYGYNPYYTHSFTNANGKIRNLVWEEFKDPVEGKLLAVNPPVICLRLDFNIFFNYGLRIRVRDEG